MDAGQGGRNWEQTLGTFTPSRRFGFLLSLGFGISLAIIGGFILWSVIGIGLMMRRYDDFVDAAGGAWVLIFGTATFVSGLLFLVLGSMAYRGSRAAMYGMMALGTIYVVLFNAVGMHYVDDHFSLRVMIAASPLLWAGHMRGFYCLSVPGGNVTGRTGRERQQGFTLIEMAIVLTIIGLIIGGIMTGRDMIRNSQLQAVTGEVSRYTQAFHNFHDKYLALPGDFAGATALWGTASGGCPNGLGTGTQTCDGNGNGLIFDDWNVNPYSGNYAYESFRAWQHLANAGMIDGNYTGVASSGAHSGYSFTPGTNVPASSIPGGGYYIAYEGIGIPDMYGGNYGHILWLSGIDSWDGSPLLTGAEAQALDAKADDGLPGTGNIKSMSSTAKYNCATTADPTTAVYITSVSGVKCFLIFITGF